MKVTEMTLGLSPTLKIGSGFFKPSATLKIELLEGEDPVSVAEELQTQLNDIIMVNLATEMDIAEELDGELMSKAKKRVATEVREIGGRNGKA